MAYPYDNDDNDYAYGLNEKQIRERMNHAIYGDPDDDDDIYEAWSGLEDEDADDEDDDSPY
jgi:hypothetical protein